MTKHRLTEAGPPDFKIAGFQVWIRDRQYPDAQDYWDGNWLHALAHCRAAGAEVWSSGPILHLSEVSRWLGELHTLHETLTGTASLDCMEPELSATIQLKDGRGELRVRITPNHLTQTHEFRFDVDQSYLHELISMLDGVLQRFPIRGKP